jgi:hypothetical protein
MENPDSGIDPIALKPRNEYNHLTKSIHEYAYAEDCNIEYRKTMEDGNILNS